ncbi:MAG: 30S ribosome-binding factor RbfA [Clostridia bacterium]|nr:30S ribosome-binding factor RbfA [Clostridia bacterium]
MSKGYRTQRLGEEIRKIISEMLVRGDLKDPGFQGMIGINSVEVTNDGSYATIYITALGENSEKDFSEQEKSVMMKAFQRSKGHIRSEIAKKVTVRHVPELLFRFDSSLEYGMKMDKILTELNIASTEDDEDNQ